MKRGARVFYFMGVLILILTAWTGFEIQWNDLGEGIGTSIFLSLVVSASVGVTEIAVSWFVGLYIEEK